MKFYRLVGQNTADAKRKEKLAELEGRNATGSEERARPLQARAPADEMAR
ncbi:hypothetical protein [Nitrosospira sp. Is2]|nr:hypothetical protein [Nitrosospira sp. Is2]WON74227.1 hypothetical protein R5L00_01685 [Nitrosospira sp. Is2]